MKKLAFVMSLILVMLIATSCNDVSTESDQENSEPNYSVNKEWTSHVKTFFAENFDMADWYPIIEKIQVLQADASEDAIIKITVKESNQKYMDTVGNAAFAEYCFAHTDRPFTASSVSVVLDSGEVVFTRDK